MRDYQDAGKLAAELAAWVGKEGRFPWTMCDRRERLVFGDSYRPQQGDIPCPNPERQRVIAFPYKLLKLAS